VNAEAFINKASFLVTNSQQEVLNLQYKVVILGFFSFVLF
jgi:COP9 signalosome complex subunit 4